MSRAELRERRLILAMVEYFSGDPRRVQHFIKVHSFAVTIATLEGVDEKTLEILSAAAIVHDIGIKPAEEQYGKGHCGGKLQEQLGPEPARELLTAAGYDEEVTERACFLVAHHHTYQQVEGIDWQILLEADFLVNAFEDNLSGEAVKSFREKVFKTKSGTKMLDLMYS